MKYVVFAFGLVCIVAIGLIYHYVVQPREAVWDDRPRPWERAPIVVSAPDDFREPTEVIVGLFNRQVGCRLLLFAMSGDIDVRVETGVRSPCGRDDAVRIDPDEAAGAFLCPGARAEIHIAYPGDLFERTWIVAHELGHVLGLAHDDSGLMREKVPVTFDKEGHRALPIIRLTDKDAAALRGRYCP